MPFLGIFLNLLPLFASTVAPYVTEVVKNVVESGGKKIPSILKGPLNIIFSAALAAVCGGVVPGVEVGAVDAGVLGALVGLGSSAGFKVGKKS